jgi:adenylate kinase family enzyme
MKKRQLGFDLVLLGDSTSGKDTQAAILESKYNVLPVASGAYLRSLMRRKKFAKLLKKVYLHGRPAPTEIMLGFLRQSFRKIKRGQNFIFVGAARLKPEAEFLKKYLDKHHRDFLVIYIRISKREVLRRSLVRGRPGDNDPTFIKNRFAYYRSQVSRTIAFYKKHKKLKYVNGEHSIHQVAETIDQIIHDHQRSQANRNP